ncbi:hypothetical protein Tco_0665023 [Tanacetum coccineum]
MSTYLKNMAGYKHSQLKSKKVVKGSKTRTEESSKRAGDELESDMSKKQKIDEHVEVEKDDQEEAEMKRHIEIVKDDEVAIDAIPLATKPPVIVEYKIDKDRRMATMKHVSTFTSIETEDKERESELAAGSYKRPRAEHDEESVKKRKLEENDAEKKELRACLDIVSGDEIAMDFESLASKYPIIDWKTHILTENMMYYQIIRADGSSKNYKIFSEMLEDFDRQDVVDLHRYKRRCCSPIQSKSDSLPRAHTQALNVIHSA